MAVRLYYVSIMGTMTKQRVETKMMIAFEMLSKDRCAR